MGSQYAQALEQQRRFARWVDSPIGVRSFLERGSDQLEQRRYYQTARVTLAAADPYHWVPEMCGLLAALSADMPRWTLRRDALPTDFGFCWFADPLPLPETTVCVTAIAWGSQPQLWREPDGEQTLVLTAYVNHDGYPDGIDIVLNANWAFGDAMSVDTLPMESAPAADVRRQQRLWRYIAAIFALLEQNILVATPQAIDRAAGRRLKKAKARTPPAILVVHLRRRHREGDDANGEPYPYSCRWFVRRHWRQQYYPSTGEYRPILIMPYIKGPDDKPLRAPTERVFAVVR